MRKPSTSPSPWTLASGAGALNLNNGLATGGFGLTVSAAGAGNAGGTIAGAISGTGSVTKTGTGTLTLNGPNSYSGGTTFAAGVLNVGNSAALGTSGTLSFTGGTLQFSAANTADYSARFSSAASQDVKLDTNGQNMTIGTGFGGNGTSLTKLGAGTLTVNGANIYTGATTLAGGVLLANNEAALGSTNGGGTISFTGGTLQYGNHTDAQFNAADYSARFSTAAGQAYSIDTNGHANITYATGLTSSGGSLTKTGAGTLTLTGASTYSGATTVNGGTLAVGSAGSLSGTSITVGTGANLSVAGSVSSSGQALTVDGTSASPAGVSFSGSSFTVGNTVIGNTGTGTFTQSSGTVTTQAFRLANGTYTLSGSDSRFQPNQVEIGTGNGTFNQTGGTFYMPNFAVYVGGLSGSGTGTYDLSGANSVANLSSFYVTHGTATQHAGVLGVSFGFALGSQGVGLVGHSGTFNLDGGTFYVDSVSDGGGNASTFNFGGGTLQPIGNSTTFFQGLTTANVQGNGGAKIDTASSVGSSGYNVTIGQALIHDATLGATADGGLTN